MLANYLDFEQLRFANAFSYEITTTEDLDVEMIFIPPLFIQPFVENAIKHGVKDLKGEGKITIRLTDCIKFLKVEVVDNGKGLALKNSSNSDKYKSRSTEIVRKRLKLLRSKYKDLPKFTIDSHGTNIDSGVCVILYLPILSC